MKITIVTRNDSEETYDVETHEVLINGDFSLTTTSGGFHLFLKEDIKEVSYNADNDDLAQAREIDQPYWA